MITVSVHDTKQIEFGPINDEKGVNWRTITILSNNQIVKLDIFANDPAVLKLLFPPRRPTVGDKVVLLEGGAANTYATPPLVEGRVYTIEKDDESDIPYLLQGPGSWVMAKHVVLV